MFGIWFNSYDNFRLGVPTLGGICKKCDEFVPIFLSSDKSTSFSDVGGISIACPFCAMEQAFLPSKFVQGVASRDLPPELDVWPIPMSESYFTNFLDTCPDATPLFGGETLDVRPQTTSLVGRCICAWTDVEANIAVLLSTFLGAYNGPAASSVYLSIRNSQTKADALMAAAKIVLSAENFILFSALEKVISKISAIIYLT